ncbi:amino acid permease [Tsuneonella suprasediminis]|uniref:Amino acid permease n=1 Tax=Tsuneonella suprasediminis TaxID=2306996 RepID=A0A419QZY5_9SPHN|nr:APC family permease [Tsuneonella suprasediminis]RJX66810.1 amino acid permease [Tsuneonella suprasediminis]
MDSNVSAPSGSERVLGPGGAWAMAVGGMIGGGIFSTLGVVISVAGEWTWVSFLLGGIVALASGHSYSALTRQVGQSGGSYAYLREMGWKTASRIAVWVLVAGYTLTVSVYAVTFGAYAAFVFGMPQWVALLAGIAAIVILAGVNLLGAAEATLLEKVAVWGKLAILLLLAGVGLWHWAPERLMLEAGDPVGFGSALIGMGVVFMAYEGFQLLSYDYEEMRDAPRTIAVAMPLAIIVTTITYIVVSLGAGMLAGADAIVANKEVALAIAGREALGVAGFIAVSVAATFSAGSAINATVFATARLAEQAAQDGEMPALFASRDERNVPWFGTIVISAVAIVLVLVGGIEQLVEGGSFVFLIVFGLVNWLAIIRRAGQRWIAAIGLTGSCGAAAMLILHLLGIA